MAKPLSTCKAWDTASVAVMLGARSRAQAVRSILVNKNPSAQQHQILGLPHPPALAWIAASMLHELMEKAGLHTHLDAPLPRALAIGEAPKAMHNPY